MTMTIYERPTSLPEPEPEDHEEAYQRRMRDRHGLLPADRPGITLREYCGQLDAPYERPSWFDHPRTWIGENGVEVLTVEPYDHVREVANAEKIVRDIAGLPLIVDGPHPGVWHKYTALIMFRVDPGAPPMRSFAEITQDVAELVARQVLAEQAAARHLYETLPPPRTYSLRGLVATVLAAPDTLSWAAEKLAAHVLVGHLRPEQAVEIVAACAQQVGRPRHHVPQMLNMGYLDACRAALTDARVEVHGLLGPDWLTRLEAVRHHPGVEEIRGLPLMRQWLSDTLTEETYG